MRLLSCVLLLTFTWFIGCKKEVFDADGYYGTGTVRINGETRSAKLKVFPDDRYCSPDSCINFLVDSFSNEGVLMLSYGILGIPAKVGRYPLMPSSSIGTLEALELGLTIYVGDGSAATVYGSFEESPKNYVEITHFDSVTGDVEGKFEGRLIQDPVWLLPSMPITDTLLLESGHFKGKVKWD